MTLNVTSDGVESNTIKFAIFKYPNTDSKIVFLAFREVILAQDSR